MSSYRSIYTLIYRGLFRKPYYAASCSVSRLIHSSNVRFNECLIKYLKLDKSEAEHLCLKYPVITKLTDQKFAEIIETVRKIGFRKKVLLDEPLLFSLLPATIKFRYEVLNECGVVEIRPHHLTSYLQIIKGKTVAQLRNQGILHPTMNIENKLASHMTEWPTSLTTLIYGDSESSTLHVLRLKIMQRYLELMLDVSEDEFVRAIKTYPTIKHRPLAAIDETLQILQSKIAMSADKIKSNMYLIHADPNNLKLIIYKLRTIAGINVTEVIRACPRIAVRKYASLLETKQILKDFNISDEAQIRCFSLYTLGVETVRERLQQAYDIPEFEALLQHPRFLKMIFHKNTVMARLRKLYANNKKCSSLNILSGSKENYVMYEKSHGDKSGKGKDVLFYFSCLSRTGSSKIKSIVRRHPFWLNVPLSQIKYVHKKLMNDFAADDITENCLILLYPWNKITTILRRIKKEKCLIHQCQQIDTTKLNKSQKLSLTLYLLEEKHYFSGNGVWSVENIKSVIDLVTNEMVQN